MNKLYYIITIILLSSCSNIKYSMGIIKEPPDEYKVVSYPDLIIPPNFDLVPPRYPISSDMYNVQNQERQIKPRSLNSNEANFLNKINLPDKNPDIRNIILSEQKHRNYIKEQKLTSKLRYLSGKESDKKVIIDPIEENKRIKENLSKNKPITEGEVKEISKEKSLLDKILKK